MKTPYFNDVIQIEDTFNVNSFLDRLSREQSKHRVKDLNSVFIKHMFSRTENPSDSEISPDYIERIHETGAILLNLSDKIRKFKQTGGVECKGFQYFAKRMKNLIDLINAEKFDFEDLHAWRMGSKMETMFRERWQTLSDEFSKIRISLNNRIRQNERVSGKISSIGEINEIVNESQNQMIETQKISINAIRDLELEPYYKERLLIQLTDQIQNESRDLKFVLKDLFHQYEHEIKRKKGKFSNSSLIKKMGEQIDNEEAVENISDIELRRKFNKLWDGIIKSTEILEFRETMRVTQMEQIYKYRHDLKKGFELCFENDRFDIVAKQEFESLRSIEDWKFTEEQFKRIKLTDDDRYFQKALFKKVWETITGTAKSHKGLMPQILNQFKQLINQNPNTKKNFDGFVDNKVVLDICSQFEETFRLRISSLELENYVKPLFKVHVVGFACFKLLLPRLQQNLYYYQTSKDPVNELNTKRDFFENLYRSKLLGAKQSVLWEQKLTDAMLELLVEIFLNPVGSQETHDLIYKFIQNSGTNRQRADFNLKILKYTVVKIHDHCYNKQNISK